MKQEDKDLLLRDLCARLPYNVKANNEIQGDFVVDGIYGNYIFVRSTSRHGWINCNNYHIEKVKPYLFPLSSMTEEQVEKLKEELCDMYDPYHDYDSYENWGVEVLKKHIHSDNYKFTFTVDVIDWLNKNHFDYRGLIEKGLANDATGLNIY